MCVCAHVCLSLSLSLSLSFSLSLSLSLCVCVCQRTAKQPLETYDHAHPLHRAKAINLVTCNEQKKNSEKQNLSTTPQLLLWYDILLYTFSTPSLHLLYTRYLLSDVSLRSALEKKEKKDKDKKGRNKPRPCRRCCCRALRSSSTTEKYRRERASESEYV